MLWGGVREGVPSAKGGEIAGVEGGDAFVEDDVAWGEGLGGVFLLDEDEEGEEGEGDGEGGDGYGAGPGDIASPVEAEEESEDCGNEGGGAGEIDTGDFGLLVGGFDVWELQD